MDLNVAPKVNNEIDRQSYQTECFEDLSEVDLITGFKASLPKERNANDQKVIHISGKRITDLNLQIIVKILKYVVLFNLDAWSLEQCLKRFFIYVLIRKYGN